MTFFRPVFFTASTIRSSSQELINVRFRATCARGGAPVASASAERPRPELARPIRKAGAIRTATFPRWNRVLLPTRLLGSESNLTVCEARVTQNHNRLPGSVAL
jgi:hypothetical protein